jgi:asparagine synthase (glutamine-hydrolysing)
LTKDFVKVVLTGDAGDENFAGYRRYLFGQWVSLLTKVPEKMRKEVIPPWLKAFASFHVKEAKLNRLADFLEMLTHNQEKNYLEQIKVFNAKEKANIYTEDFHTEMEKIDPLDFLLKKFEDSGTDNFLERLLYVDINSYLPEDLLVKMDIATMANSLEARVPFLDHTFMEFVASIPSQLKLKGSKTKFVLKAAFKDFLPDAILKRGKMGFGVPVSRWFRNELKDYVYTILLDPRTLNRGYFKREGIERLLNDHIGLRYDHSARIWALLFLEMWFRVFIDKGGDSFLHET